MTTKPSNWISSRPEPPHSTIIGVGIRPWISAVAILVLLVGGALRLRHYIDGHSLYIDEIFLALSIAGRPFGEALRSIAWDQNIHPAFMAIERLALLLGGINE